MSEISAGLGYKAYLGFVQLAVFMGLAVFLPAWSIRFWQAWVYLITFLGATLIITAYFLKASPELIARRVNAGPAAETEKSQKVIQTFASLFFTGIISVPGLDHRFGWSHVPLYLVVAGDVCVAAGFYLVFLVFKENSYTSAVIETAREQTVVSTGPYSAVRHPMYSGALLMLFATPLALGSFRGSLFFPPMLVALAWRLLAEEKFLAASLPGYAEYCQKVRYRLVPLIW